MRNPLARHDTQYLIEWHGRLIEAGTRASRILANLVKTELSRRKEQAEYDIGYMQQRGAA